MSNRCRAREAKAEPPRSAHPHQMSSTVRSLGIEVDDATSIGYERCTPPYQGIAASGRQVAALGDQRVVLGIRLGSVRLERRIGSRPVGGLARSD